VRNISPGRLRNAYLLPMNDNLSRRDFLKLAGSAGLALGISEILPTGRYFLNNHQVSPKFSTNNSPNLLFIVLDTLRAQNMSLYGYSRRTTSNLERLASKGVVFDYAIASCSWTLPSHASMFTGRWHHELSTSWARPLDDTYPTLAEILRDQGYTTAGIVSNTNYCSREFGLDRGFEFYQDYDLIPWQMILSPSISRKILTNNYLMDFLGIHQLYGRKNAERIIFEFKNWLTSQTGDQPFFAFLIFFDNHDPYIAPEPFATMFSDHIPRGFLPSGNMGSPGWESFSAETIRELMTAYDTTIAYVDYLIGMLISWLSNLNLMENTLVVITSDHGEQFGEHGLMNHANSLYVPTLHVPLLLSMPSRIPADLRITQPVTLRDLPATILDILGKTSAFKFPGNSLTRFWKSSISDPKALLSEIEYEPSVPKWFPISGGNIKSLILEKYHFIQYRDRPDELFDYAADPAEKNDLSKESGYSGILTEFRNELKSILNSG
jgi:arylsulfatase A-like enzyme